MRIGEWPSILKTKQSSLNFATKYLACLSWASRRRCRRGRCRRSLPCQRLGPGDPRRGDGAPGYSAHPRLDRLCVRRDQAGSLCRGRSNPSPRRLWGEQAGRRESGADRQSPAHHRADVVAVQPVRQELREDDAQDRRRAGQRPCRRRPARHADGCVRSCRRNRHDRSDPGPRRAGRHLSLRQSRRDDLVRAGAARLRAQQGAGRTASATVEAIATADYPTPARRPANSRLSTAKIERVFGIVPRPWEEALADVVASLVPVPDRPPVR